MWAVRHECLEPPGLNVTEAARRLGISRKQLMGIRLDKAFSGGADTWYRLQSTWELAQAKKKGRSSQRPADTRTIPVTTSIVPSTVPRVTRSMSRRKMTVPKRIHMGRVAVMGAMTMTSPALRA